MNIAVDPPPTSAPTSRSGRWVKTLGTGMWHAMSDMGRARAQRALLDIAHQCEATRPALAAELRTTSRALSLA